MHISFFFDTCSVHPPALHAHRPFQPKSESIFLSDPGVPGVRSMGPDVSHSIQDYVAYLTDVTLADNDSNSTPADDVNRAIPGNVAMQVAPPGGQN